MNRFSTLVCLLALVGPTVSFAGPPTAPAAPATTPPVPTAAAPTAPATTGPSAPATPVVSSPSTTVTVASASGPTAPVKALKACDKMVLGFPAAVFKWSKDQGETKCNDGGTDTTASKFAGGGWMTLEDLVHFGMSGVPHWHCGDATGVTIENLETHTCTVAALADPANARVTARYLVAQMRDQGAAIKEVEAATATNTADITAMKAVLADTQAQVATLTGGQASLEADLDAIDGKVTGVAARVSESERINSAQAEQIDATDAAVGVVDRKVESVKKEVKFSPAGYGGFGLGYVGSIGLGGISIEGNLGVELPWVRLGGNGFVSLTVGDSTIFGGTGGLYLASWEPIKAGPVNVRFGVGPVVGYEQFLLGNRDADGLSEAEGYAMMIGGGGFINLHTEHHAGVELNLNVTADTGTEVDTSTGAPSRMDNVSGLGVHAGVTAFFGGK